MPDTRSPLVAYSMAEGDWLVRGTLDPVTALSAVTDEMQERYDTEELLWGVSPKEFDGQRVYGDLDPSAVVVLADRLHEMVAAARPGLYRILPVGPHSASAFEGWSWALGYASARGRGVFEGVCFCA